MARNTARPLSPHLTIWKWGPHMVVSILHRATGVALTIGGLILLTWWLLALSGGTEAYATFAGFLGWKAGPVPLIQLGLVALTWAFFQHTLSGIRHLVMDTGAGFELKTNRTMAYATIVGSLLLTALFWALLLGKGA
ncbi:succinate dehydrogenase, cytochrome b556 subunit [Sphingomonas astaxanthinifaciens]|uniref:Succinate dehydrogenase cytochrome b556 subunit n=1 Tax=Sphingomonas astaxanthinifaciens DSM 22298 TaxID=1123267 RepID=A0ABQ5Z5S0_9SPHN|nr:succinate dehydrogenase, cytochrome b556 subunit [Sphingomonas astaxanthinifaciens]GLR47329.1 succinate dehydrogenase, cytochrome b556 subunit [Sphingomonas astaxanthinifaciens DSM 22298]